MLKTGIDLLKISRIEDAIKKSDRFMDRVCTPNEKSYLRNHNRFVEKVAGIFALKEAFSKALGTGFGEELSFQDIEVSYHPAPRVEYRGEKFKDMFLKCKVSCSVSHDDGMLVAIVVLQGE